ncbi:hypothetical protein M747DRAFT_57814 [Aspergillus niger ATCC 13496]|uniref:Transmembrane protein n=1 Tax=Aspergillus niger ATCC 13496 TaxID=1353008 RepID=A0A370CCA3_ASPNG|nr:hypothetical protein M747DRAFT_57814 [Aspergillus niger ATCC 13496]
MALDGSGHEQRKDVSISCSAHFYLVFRALLPLIGYLYLGFFFIRACIKSRVFVHGGLWDFCINDHHHSS